MNFIQKNPKLIQLGFVLLGFVVLVLMTGQYSEIIDIRDGFIKAVERGEISSSVGLADSIGMLLSGQLPPQLVRIPEINFFNPVFENSIVYILVSLLFLSGSIIYSFKIVNRSTQLSIFEWFKQYWTKLFIYTPVSIFGGLFIVPSMIT